MEDPGHFKYKNLDLTGGILPFPRLLVESNSPSCFLGKPIVRHAVEKFTLRLERG
jgi:hypothetical protein